MSSPGHVIVIGCGGLGGPIALALGGAGVRLTLIDSDVVDTSNLHRQIQFGVADVGRAKVDALADALVARGAPPPRAVRQHLSAGNLAHLLAEPGVIVEGTDSPATKFLVGDFASRHARPHVIAAAVGFGGQIFVGNGLGACFRCLFEGPPDHAASCTADGVLGPAVGAVAGLAAQAVAHIFAGAGAFGSLHVLADVRRSDEARVVPLTRRADCAAHPRSFDSKENPMATIRIPTPLRKLTDGKDEVVVQGDTVRAALDDLDRLHPGIKARLYDDKGELKKFINLYANDEDIRGLQQLDTPLRDADELSIVPAIAGG